MCGRSLVCGNVVLRLRQSWWSVDAFQHLCFSGSTLTPSADLFVAVVDVGLWCRVANTYISGCDSYRASRGRMVSLSLAHDSTQRIVRSADSAGMNATYRITSTRSPLSRLSPWWCCYAIVRPCVSWSVWVAMPFGISDTGWVLIPSCCCHSGFAVPGGHCVPNSPMHHSSIPKPRWFQVVIPVWLTCGLCSAPFGFSRSAVRQRGRCPGEGEPDVVIEPVQGRLCWESLLSLVRNVMVHT